MPNLRKPANKKVTYRRAVPLTPVTGKQLEEIAKKEGLAVATVMRKLIERSLKDMSDADASLVGAK